MPAKSAHTLMACFVVRMGQVGGILDYSKKKEAQLNEEMESSQEQAAKEPCYQHQYH